LVALGQELSVWPLVQVCFLVPVTVHTGLHAYVLGCLHGLRAAPEVVGVLESRHQVLGFVDAVTGAALLACSKQDFQRTSMVEELFRVAGGAKLALGLAGESRGMRDLGRVLGLNVLLAGTMAGLAGLETLLVGHANMESLRDVLVLIVVAVRADLTILHELSLALPIRSGVLSPMS